MQIQKQQQLVTKTRELKDMKDDLYQCQQEQGDQVHHKVGVGVSLAGSHCIILSLCVYITQSEMNFSHKPITFCL